MTVEGFEFDTKDLDYGSIEDAICRHYDLGYANSSNFMEILPGRGQSITILALKGSVTCFVSAYGKKDSDLFIVSVSNVDMKRNRGM